MQYHQEYTIYGTCFWLSMLPKSRKSIFCIQCFAKLSLWSLYLFTLQSALCKKRGDRIQNIVACSFCLLAPLCVEEVMGLPKTEKLALFQFFLPLNRGQRVKGEGGGIHIFCECWVCKTARPFSQQDMTIQQTAFQKHWPTNSRGGFCNISGRNMQTWEIGSPLYKKWLFLFSAIRRMQKHAKNCQLWRWATRKGRLLSKMLKFLGDWEKSPKDCPQVGKWERRGEWGIW